MQFFYFSSRVILILAVLIPTLGKAQEVEIPATIQYSLFTKILSFDRNVNLRTTSSGNIVIGILYQEKVRSSVIAKDEMVAAIKGSSVQSVGGHPITYKLIPLPEAGDVRPSISSGEISVFYLTPLRGVDLASILSVSKSRKILTLSGVPSYCDKGVSVCIEEVAERPGIAINLAASRLEGSDLSSQLLKMARVIQ